MDDPLVGTWQEELSLIEELMRSRPEEDWTQERERIAELQSMIANASTVGPLADDAANEVRDKGEPPGGANFA